MVRFFLFSLIVVNLIFSLNATEESIKNLDLSDSSEKESESELFRFPRGLSGGPRYLSRLPVKRPTHPKTEPSQQLPPFLGGIRVPGARGQLSRTKDNNYFILTTPDGKQYKLYFQVIETGVGGSPGEGNILISPKAIASIVG